MGIASHDESFSTLHACQARVGEAAGLAGVTDPPTEKPTAARQQAIGVAGGEAPVWIEE